MLMEQRLEFLIRRFQEQRLLPKLHQKVSVFFSYYAKGKGAYSYQALVQEVLNHA